MTPLSGAFTKPICSNVFGDLLKTKNIQVVTDFATARIDNETHKLVSWDDREVSYDLLVTIPTNMGDQMVARSGLGDELNFIPTDKHTLQSKKHQNIFVIGDATDLPASKAGSVAHFQAEVLTENILNWIDGKPLSAQFDGHANCFIETGFGKAFLIDFNYDLKPVPGTYPIPHIGPLSLLKETRLNHLGKRAFKSIYWHMLLKARPLPGISHQMSYAGKEIPPKK